MQHGTVSGYVYHHCRCHECRLGWLDYWRRLHAERRAQGLCLRCCAPVEEYARCEKCRQDAAEAKRRHRRRKIAAQFRAGTDQPQPSASPAP